MDLLGSSGLSFSRRVRRGFDLKEVSVRASGFWDKLTAVPGIIWFFLFCLAPLVLLLIASFLTRGVYGQIEWSATFANFIRFFDWVYLTIFFRSVKLAVGTVFGTLLVGYPIALLLARMQGRKKLFLLALVILPFWTNSIVKTVALKSILFAYLPDLPQSLLVFLGMIMNYLPFMILPLMAGLQSMDESLIDAARDLFASPFQILWHVIIPLSRPAIMTGCLFVFVPALGEFVIPEILGGSQGMLMGNLISDQFFKSRDWPFGSALSVFLMAFIPVTSILFRSRSQ
jgi:spermidine/putrescine transport system permease protein